MNENKFIEKMKEKYKDKNYLIIYAGKNSYENSIILCLNCNNKIICNTGELFRKRRKTLCRKCEYIRKDTIKNREFIIEKIKNEASNIYFFMDKLSNNGNYGDTVEFTCNNCGRVNKMRVGHLITNNSSCSCCYCSGQKNKKDHVAFNNELNKKFKNKFKLLSEYVDINTEITIQCMLCDFIRNVKPTAIIRSGYCPKCSKNNSIGEIKIKEWLISKSFYFETQKYFKEWEIGLHYFDFFIPENNLLIEFHGIQHYHFNSFFHKNNDDYIYRQERDNIKRDMAIKNNYNYVSIKYTLLDELETILPKIFDSTTISKESRGKCLEIESFCKEEDIVWS